MCPPFQVRIVGGLEPTSDLFTAPSEAAGATLVPLYVRDMHSGEEQLKETELTVLGNGYDWAPTSGRFRSAGRLGERTEIYTKWVSPGNRSSVRPLTEQPK